MRVQHNINLGEKKYFYPSESYVKVHSSVVVVDHQ